MRSPRATDGPSSPLLVLRGSDLHAVIWLDGLYELLDVPPTATREQIKRAYWAKAKQAHPDLYGGDPRKAEDMVRLNRAREVLVTPKLRDAYDWLRPALLGA